MKKIKFFTILGLISLFLFPSLSSAEEAKVSFSDSSLEEVISQDTIDALLEQAEGDDITIHRIIDGSDLDESLLPSLPAVDEGLIQPYGLIYTYSVNGIKVTTSRSALAAVSYASVARGKTVTMSSTFTSTNSLSIGGTFPSGASSTISASIGSTKTKTVKKGVKLTGPPAGYSSRMYYITRFVDKGTFNLNRKTRLTGNVKTYKNTFTRPATQDPFVDWSRDIK